jgi:tetratricopeptide (TPR) repeat protein
MKNWMHLSLAAAVAGLIGFGSAFLSTPERAARGADAGPSAAELAATLAELRVEQAQLAERLSALPASAPGAPSSSRVELRDIESELDEAIAAYMEKNLGTLGERGDEIAPADAAAAAIADRILTGQVEDDELDALWEKLRKEKRIDGVVAEIERQAELAPNNPDLQSELGKAYLQKLFDVGAGPMTAVWGEKADEAFDRALELDETHWEARYRKALALSNWPDFLGKRGESMRNFEILMEQQERAVPAADHAYTYFFLGNLHDQNGEHEKALELWKRGAARFPASEELRAKTGGR